MSTIAEHVVARYKMSFGGDAPANTAKSDLPYKPHAGTMFLYFIGRAFPPPHKALAERFLPVTIDLFEAMAKDKLNLTKGTIGSMRKDIELAQRKIQDKKHFQEKFPKYAERIANMLKVMLKWCQFADTHGFVLWHDVERGPR